MNIKAKQAIEIVHVARYNKKAIDFYRSLGFEETFKRWEDERSRMKSGAILPLLEMVLKARTGDAQSSAD